MRKYLNSHLLSITLSIFMCIAVSSIVSASTPIIEDVSYSPEKPAPGSTVTFNATVIGNNPLVYVNVSECMEGMCFLDSRNVSMQKVGDNEYQANVTLQHEEATSVHYYITVESNGTWYHSREYEFNLSVKTDDTTENNVPGFELMYLMISVIFILLIRDKRKR